MVEWWWKFSILDPLKWLFKNFWSPLENPLKPSLQKIIKTLLKSGCFWCFISFTNQTFAWRGRNFWHPDVILTPDLGSFKSRWENPLGERFINSGSGRDIVFLNFIIFCGKLFGPVLLLIFKSWIIFITSSGEVGNVKKVFGFGLLR